MRALLRGRAARGAAGALLAAGAAIVASCGEDLHTGPEKFHATLEPVNWADTLVLGDGRPVAVRVIDDQGREVLDAGVHWAVAAPAVLGASALRASVPAAGAVGDGAVDARGSDSVRVDTRRTGTTDVVVSLTDSRFYPATLTRRATVVVAGVRASSARDTTLTALGDTALVLGTGLVRSGAALAPRAGAGVTWARVGAGAVQLTGAGDSVRVVGRQGGTDTLVATHPFCLTGAHCADTVVVHVAQRGALATTASAYRAWSFGDSIVPTVLLQDARGHAVVGATFQVAPVTGADSAVVGTDAPAAPGGVSPVRSAVGPAAASVSASRSVATLGGVTTRGAAARVAAHAPLRLTVRGDAPGRVVAPRGGLLAVEAPNAAPVALPPLVARGNGTARVAVRASGPDGALLAVDTISVVVRQIAAAVHVTPPQALLTPGDSIPVRMEARDARGYLIADAAFVPAAAGAAVSSAGVVTVAPNASAGTATVLAAVVGPANPGGYPDAPIAAPVLDTAVVQVRVPAPTASGDTTGAPLDAPVFTPDGKPVVGAWVRFIVPGGTLSVDSAVTGPDGVAHARWRMPAQVGAYTATAVLLGTPSVSGAGSAGADSAGRIVLRRTLGVRAGAAARFALLAGPPSAVTAGATLSPGPAVRLLDSAGNAVAQAGVPVTVALGAGAPGALGGTLTVLTDSAGVAHFPDLVLTGPTGARTLSFTAAGMAPITSATIAVGVGGFDAGRTTVAVSAPTVASGATVVVTVTPRDASGNPIGAGHAVAVTAGAPNGAPNGGAGVSTATASAVADRGDGTYTVTLTGVRAGTALAVNATVDGAAAPGAALVVVPGAPAAVVVSPTSVALTAVGSTGTLAVASATDAAGNAVPTAGLTWTSSAPGTVSVAPNASGSGAPQATVTGLAPGSATITAQLGGATATAAVGVQQTASQVMFVAGAGQSAHVGSAVAITPAVRVLDAGGAPIVGATVTFAVGDHGTNPSTVGGSATQTVTTGANGVATAGAWTMGGAIGTYTLTASVGAVTPVSITAAATVGGVNAGLTTVVLSAPTVASGATAVATVVPMDGNGNRLGAGRTVTVVVGSVPAATGASTALVAAVHDAGDGSYTVVLTGVRAGTAAAVTATVDGVNVTNSGVTLQVTPGAASALAVTPVTLSFSTVGTAATLTAQTTDPAGNTASLAGLTWTSSTPSVATVAAAANGMATVTSAGQGTATITAHLGALSAGAPVAVQQAAAQLVKLAGDGLTARVGSATAAAPSVRVRDANGAPVAGASVVFSIVNGGTAAAGSVGGGASETVTTAADGSATASGWTLGTAAGAYTLGAAVPGAPAVQFAATAVVGPVSAGQSTLVLSNSSVASGATVTATVTPKDAYGNLLGAGRTVVVLFGTAGQGAGVSSGTASAATYAGNGAYTATLTGTHAGTPAAITATVDGVAVPTSAPTLMVTAGGVAQLTLAPTTLAFSRLGATGTLTASATDANGNAVPTTGITWATSAPTVAAVVAAGVGTATVTSAGNGAATVTAQLGSATATAAVSVQQVAAQLVKVAGDNATAAVGGTTSPAPRVKAVDAGGAPVAGVPVTFAVGTGPAAATINGGANQTVATAADGTAAASGWTLGTTPGTYTATAAAAGVATVGFTATAASGAVSAAQSTVAVSAATVASAQTVTVTVTPKDAYGNRIGAGRTVAITYGTSPATAGASAGTLSAVTNVGDGTYTATLTGTTAGAASAVRATVDGTAITAAPTVTVTAGAVTALTIVAGNNQTAVAGTAVAITPQVRAVDANGNPVSGASVYFTAIAGGGRAGNGVATSDANGLATAGSWTLGATAGQTQTLTASIPGVVAAVPFTATAVAGSASGTQTTVGLSAATVRSGNAVTVTVTPKDANGNPLGAGRGVSVAFGTTPPAAGASAGTVSAVTDAGNGNYTATITGTTAGTATAVVATVDGVTASTTPTLMVNAGSASSMVIAAGNGQSATVGTAVATAPQVRVTDAGGNPVSGVSVTFAVVSGGGTLTGATATTTNAGLATLGAWQLGTTVGTQSIQATSTGLPSAAFTATAVAGAAARVTMSRTTLPIAAYNGRDTVRATVTDAYNNVLRGVPATWASTASGVAAVASSGMSADSLTNWAVVSGVADGSATISATRGTASGTTAATVHQVATSITAAAPNGGAAIALGDTARIAVTATDAAGSPVGRSKLLFTIADTTGATVDTAGRVRGIRPSRGTITISAVGGSATTTVSDTIGTNFNYRDFCTLNGLNISGTTRQGTGCVLRLTTDSVNQSGGVWQPVKQKLSNGFTTTFKYQMTNGGGYGVGKADGLALVVQSTSATATGSSGGGIGYPGLTNALAIELDTWQNSGAPYNDPDDNHVAVQSCGSAALSSYHDSTSTGCTVAWPANPGFDLNDGAVHSVTVVYTVSGNTGNLKVYFDGSSTAVINKAVYLGSVKGANLLDANGKAWIGFTAATGGAYQRHDLLSWTLTPTP